MKSSADSLICVGECMVELSGIEGPLKLGQGGDTFNSAVYLSRVLGGGRNVSYATRLGCDPFSDRLVAAIAAEGINTDLITKVPGSLPAIYAISLVGSERHFHYWRSDAPVRKMLSEPEPDLERRLREAGLVLFSGITLAVLSEKGRERLLDCAAGKMAYIVNHRSALWPDLGQALDWHAKAMSSSAYVFISEEEREMLMPETETADLCDGCGGELIVSVGSAGCMVWREGAKIAGSGVEKVAAIDTTAAGDSLAARYLAGRWRGEQPRQAVEMACLLAQEVVRHHGAIIPMEAMPSACLLG